MKILLTNDDGYRSEPYQSLGKALHNAGHEVWMISPEDNCSGISHAFTLVKPVSLRAIPPHENFLANDRFFAFMGTPVDCVKFSLVEYFKDSLPDLVVSGINFGANLGIDVLYSGTVAAAIEGYVNGVSSIALSHYAHKIAPERLQDNIHWLIDFVAQAEPYLRSGKRLLNVNFPDINPELRKGMRVTRTGNHGFTNSYDRRVSPVGREYYWLHGEMQLEGEASDSDKVAVHEGYVSVTPLKIDYTADKERKVLETFFNSLS
jgi:5'-nucleotidase